jgi:hypothetical protein
MTHLRQDKYPRAGWCEFRPRCLKVRFAWGSAVGADVRRVMSHDRVTRVSRDLRMSCGHFHKTWIRPCDVCSTVHTALNTWAPLGEKWWCMSYLYVVLFCRYAKHDYVSKIRWNWLRGWVRLPSIIRTSYIMCKLFFWWGTDRTDMCHDVAYSFAWSNWTSKNKLEVKLNRKNETHKVTPNSTDRNFLIQDRNSAFYPPLERLQNSLGF